jgi:hypothetical protein
MVHANGAPVPAGFAAARERTGCKQITLSSEPVQPGVCWQTG